MHQGGHAGAPRHGRHEHLVACLETVRHLHRRRHGEEVRRRAAVGHDGARDVEVRCELLLEPLHLRAHGHAARQQAVHGRVQLRRTHRVRREGEAGWRLGGCSTRRGGLISPRFELGGNSAGPTAAAAAATTTAAVAAAAVAGGGRWSDAPEDAQNEDEPHTSVSMKLLHNV